MFRIGFTARDKSLASILKFLDGKAYDLEERPAKEHVSGVVKSRGSIHESFDSLPATFRFREARAVLGNSAYGHLQRAIRDKRLKKVSTGQYRKLSTEG